MKLRRKRGATMGLVAACVLALVIIGFAVYFLARMLSGGKQVANATDAGAISAAKEILAITANINTDVNWPSGGTGNPPVEFTGLGVTYNDTNNEANNGLPNATLTDYNVMAYNRVAGIVLLEALNAVYDKNAGGDNGGIDNVTANIANLQALGSVLYTNIKNSAQPTSFPAVPANKVAYAFQDVTGMNNVNSAGASEPELNAPLNIGYVGNGSGATPQAGKANIYFAQNTIPLTYNSLLTNVVDNSGSKSPVPPSGFPAYASADQPLVYGYKPLVVGTLPPFFAVNTNPAQYPHLIDLGRFSAESGSPAGANVTNLPPNSISGSTKTPVNTFKGLNGSVADNLFTTAIASAVMGSGSFTYPITFQHGFIRIRNDFDTAYNNVGANPSSGPIGDYGAQSPNAEYVSNSIFNNELYQGQNQTYGGLYYWNTGNTTDPNPNGTGVPTASLNLVFCTQQQQSVPDANLPLGIDQVYQQWVPYITSVGNDRWGKNPALDPTGGAFGNWGPNDPLLPVNSGMWSTGPLTPPQSAYFYQSSVGNPYSPFATTPGTPWAPNGQLRTLSPSSDFPPLDGTQQAVFATATDMLKIDYGNMGNCSQANYDTNNPNNLVAQCDSNLQSFATSYGRGYTAATPSGGNAQNTPQGGLTNVEYIKGQVVDAYLQMGVYNGFYSATVTGPKNPSGMRYWDEQAIYDETILGQHQNVSYAQPTNDQNGANPITVPNPNNTQVNPNPVEPGGFGFGQNGTAAAYMNLITQNQGLWSNNSGTPACGGNLDLTQAGLWNTPTTVQGMLLQRCKQIWPSVQATDLYDPNNPSAGLLCQGQLDLGGAVYLYFDTTQNKLAACTANNAPAWLQAILSSPQNQPTTSIASQTLTNWGVASGYHTMMPMPDGATLNCSETQFSVLVQGNSNASGVIDAAVSFGGAAKGDLDLHDQPFMSVNASANTSDAVVFRSSSGANGLLGDLVFQNKAGLTGANGSQSGTFSAPN